MRNSCKPYRLLSDDTVGYAAQWPADDAAAPHRHNWIIRRDPLIVVSGDLPAWGLMATERGPTVSPPFFVYALVRARVIVDGQTCWLDETKALEVQYHPWCSEHRLTLPGGLHLTIACTAWQNRGAMLQFRVEGPLPATAELLVEVQGLGTAVQSWSASFVKQELVVWHPGQSQAEGARASMRGTISRSIVDAADTYGPGGFSLPPQRAIELAASAGQWETLPDQRLLLRLPLAEGALHEIGLVVGDDGSDLRFPGFAAAEQETREHYRHVLALCHSRTPDARLDAALAAAVVSLDQGRDGKAWLEGVTRWNTRWANNYQIGAAVAMGCVGDAREALLEMADVERGPGQILMSDGRSWVWSDDALPYYMLQWHRYNEATGDDLETQLAGPVGRSFERFMATRDLAGTGLAGWHRGCNSFLYQADTLNLPGQAVSPSIMVARMRRTLARAAEAAGDAATARQQRYAADLVERELMRRFWDPARGAFTPGIDTLAMAQQKGYYTDFVFPALYSQLSPYVSWTMLAAADQRLWTDAGLMRSGEFLPSGFGNDFVGFVQPCEAAEAYAALGRPERCQALLAKMAEAITTKTDCPGSAPENCNDEGFGCHAYAFGNPAGAFVLGVIQGLWGLYRTDRGQGLTWRPALPDDWEEGELHLTDLTVSFRGQGHERHYACTQQKPRSLCLQLFCAANEEITATDEAGRDMTPSVTPHPAGRCYTLLLGKALMHQVIVKRRVCVELSVPMRLQPGNRVHLKLPPGSWMTEDPRALLATFRIDADLLTGTLSDQSEGGRFWLLDTQGQRALPVDCGRGDDVAGVLPSGEGRRARGASEDIDLTPYGCNVTTVSAFRDLHASTSVRSEDDPGEIEGVTLPPLSHGAVVLEVGQNDPLTGRLHLPDFPHRLGIPLAGCAHAVTLLAAADGRVRLTGMIIAKVSLTYADGQALVREVAFWKAPAGGDAAVLPPAAGTIIAGRTVGSIDVLPDPDRPLRELAVEVLTSDVRLFLYALRLHPVNERDLRE